MILAVKHLFRAIVCEKCFIILFLHFILYLMECLLTICEKTLKSKKIIKWIKRLLLILALFSSVLLICKFVLQINLINFPGYIYILNIVISVGLYIFFHIKNKAIVDGAFSEVLNETPSEIQSEIRTQIELYFENNMSFLDTGFSFDNFVTDLKLPKKSISKTINHEMDKNFYNLLAEKRIEVAKRLLRENKEKLKIEALFRQCGFVSKSSFNLHFKKHMGMTPSQFQRGSINKI